MSNRIEMRSLNGAYITALYTITGMLLSGAQKKLNSRSKNTLHIFMYYTYPNTMIWNVNFVNTAE